MKSVLLIEKSEIDSEYGKELVEKLIASNRFDSEDKSELIISTNIIIQSGDPIFSIFNILLKKLYREQTIQIRIRL